MLEYHEIDMSERLMVIKLVVCVSASFINSYFLKIDFRFQSKVCNGCHDLVQNAMNLNDIVIVNRTHFLVYE